MPAAVVLATDALTSNNSAPRSMPCASPSAPSVISSHLGASSVDPGARLNERAPSRPNMRCGDGGPALGVWGEPGRDADEDDAVDDVDAVDAFELRPCGLGANGGSIGVDAAEVRPGACGLDADGASIGPALTTREMGKVKERVDDSVGLRVRGRPCAGLSCGALRTEDSVGLRVRARPGVGLPCDSARLTPRVSRRPASAAGAPWTGACSVGRRRLALERGRRAATRRVGACCARRCPN